jgi:glutathione S-transferase
MPSHTEHIGGRHGEIPSGQLQDLPLGAARGDRAAEKKVDFEFQHIEPDNRPDWFLAISPHKKVPVLRIDDRLSLFESNAIAEYLDETVAPRLHPEDPIARAVNRAWTDYVPTFADLVTATAYADTEADYRAAAEKIPLPFERLERALEKQGSGPYFNGAKYALVDAAYAPFLQRYLFLDRIRKLGHIEKFPRLAAWAKALVERPSTHSFPPAEFEATYRDIVRRRNKWISQFIEAPKAAAEWGAPRARLAGARASIVRSRSKRSRLVVRTCLFIVRTTKERGERP